MFKIIPLLSDQCTPQLHCLPSGRAPDTARSFTGKKRLNRRRGRVHEPPRGGKKEDRQRGGRYLQIVKRVGNYFKGYFSAAENQFSVMRLISASLMGCIENRGLVDAYHRDYSAVYTGPLMQIKM